MPVTDNARRVVFEHLAEDKTPWGERIEREFKVPVVANLWPSAYWLACVVGPGGLHHAVEPSDDEIQQIASYIEFKLATFYTESYAAQVRELPLPLVGGHNTVTFLKLGDEPSSGYLTSAVGWGYRRASWHTGAWPHAYGARNLPLPARGLSLVEVLDHIETFTTKIADNWVAWKLDHPATFPVTDSSDLLDREEVNR